MSFSPEHRITFQLALGRTPDLSRVAWPRWLRIARQERLAAMMRGALPPKPFADELGKIEQTGLALFLLGKAKTRKADS